MIDKKIIYYVRGLKCYGKIKLNRISRVRRVVCNFKWRVGVEVLVYVLFHSQENWYLIP